MLGAESIGAAIVVVCDPAYGPRIDIDGLVTQVLKLQGPEMVSVQLIEAGILNTVHGKLLCNHTRNRAAMKLNMNYLFFRRAAASSNNAFKPFATLTRTPSTPHLIARGFAMFAQTALRAGNRLTWRSHGVSSWADSSIFEGFA